MAKGRLTGIEVWDKPVCAGGKRIADVAGYRGPRTTQSIDGDETGTFVVDLTNDAVPELVEGRVLLFLYEPVAGVADFDEFYFTSVERAHEYGGTYVRVTGRSLGVFALVRAGHLADFGDGFPAYTFSYTDTVAQWWAVHLNAALVRRGFTYFALGVNESVGAYTLALDGQNGMDALQQLASLSNCEWRFRRNGQTNYLLDVVVGISSGVSPVRLLTGRNLNTIRVATDAVGERFATRLLPRGMAAPTTPSSVAKTIARARWEVTGLDGVNNDITVVSLDGDTAIKCVRFDGQFTTNAGLPASLYVVCVRTGRPFQLVNSYATTQKLRVGALGDCVVGDELEFREDQSGLARTDYLLHGSTGRWPGRVTGIASNVATVTDEFGQDPVQANDEWNGLRAEAYQFIATTTYTTMTANTPSTGRVRATVASSAGMAAGDLVVFNGADVTAPYAVATGGGERWAEIETVVSGTQIDIRRFTTALGVRDLSSWTITAGAPSNLRVYRRRTNFAAFVNDCDAAANTVTLSSALNLATNDLLVFYRLDGGLRMTTLASPTVLVYGEWERKYTRDDLRGNHDLLNKKNPWFDTWTTAGAIADGYALVNGAVTRGTTPLIGPGSVYVASCSGNIQWRGATTNAGRFLPSPLDPYLTIKCRVKVPQSATWVGNVGWALTYTDGSHTVSGAKYWLVAPGGSVTINSGDNLATAQPDAVVDVALGVTITSASQGASVETNMAYTIALMRYGVVPWVNSQPFAGGFGVHYVGGFSIEQGLVTQDTSFYCKTQRANTLHHEGNLRLDLSDIPNRTYEFRIVDLARLAPNENVEEQLDIGVAVTAESKLLQDTAFDTDKRIVGIEWDHEVRALTVVRVDSLPDRLTRLLALGGN